jgi:hypothetical protein
MARWTPPTAPRPLSLPMSPRSRQLAPCPGRTSPLTSRPPLSISPSPGLPLPPRRIIEFTRTSARRWRGVKARCSLSSAKLTFRPRHLPRHSTGQTRVNSPACPRDERCVSSWARFRFPRPCRWFRSRGRIPPGRSSASSAPLRRHGGHRASRRWRGGTGCPCTFRCFRRRTWF